MFEHKDQHPNHKHHFRKGGLRIWVLSLLQQAPSNGAEIMDRIEGASQGWWRPSPGSVYPLLDQLQQDGSIQKREDGKYELTETGIGEFQWPYRMWTRQPRTLEDFITEIDSYVSYLEDLNKSNRAQLESKSEALKNLRDRLSALIDSWVD